MVLPLAMAAGAGIGTAGVLRKGINDYRKKDIKENLPKAGPKKYKKKLKGYEYGMDTLVKGPKFKSKPKYKKKGGMSKYYADGGYVITGRD